MRQSVRWLRGRLAGQALILGYHRVADVAHDAYSLCVTPRRFGEQMEVLREYAHPLSLRELVEGWQETRLPPRAVGLTFDDGYADNLYNAKPLLERYEVSATVFVATGFAGREFWWDDLERIVSSPANLPERLALTLGGRPYEWTSSRRARRRRANVGLDCRERLLQSLYDLLLPLPAAERQQAMEALRDWAGDDPLTRPAHRAMTADEIIQMAKGGLVELGAHTVTHPVLGSLSPAEQRSEIVGSKGYLESLLGGSVSGFSYPNGSLSAETLAIVRAGGFAYACGSLTDVVWRGSDRFRLPRFWIPDLDGRTFARWLQRWLPG